MTQTKINDGGPAFPHPDERGLMGEGLREGSDGMSLRDWFAGQALVGLIAKSPFFDREGENGKPITDMVQFKADMSDSAYWYADAMLKAREVKR